MDKKAAKTDAVVNNFTWLIGGEAGYGIQTAGEIFARACMYSGLNVFTNTEYPSLIRGGYNSVAVNTSEQEINSHSDKIDILVALNKETIDVNKNTLNQNAAIIFDQDTCKEIASRLCDETQSGVMLCPVPFAKLLSDIKAEKILENSIAIGASAAVLGMNFSHIERAIAKVFGEKSNYIESNIIAAQAGYSHMKHTFPTKIGISVKQIKSQPRILASGNTALALGAVVAGCKFVSIYPMTPITQILHKLASWQLKNNMIIFQPEDEISGINAAIGASYAGVRSLVATSGGGFSLMSEALGMSAMTETPLVVIWGQRPGPSTGLPTRTSQGDLQFAIHAGQGEFPRIVIAPGDVEECFSVSHESFNLAEHWQVPVIILVDKHICECHKTTQPFSTTGLKIDRGQIIGKTENNKKTNKPKEVDEFKRYEITENGVSSRMLPGQPDKIFRQVSDEHDEFGYLTEDPEITAAMQKKRLIKMQYIEKEMPDPVVHGPKKSDITIIGWGSTKGSIIDALPLLQARGITTNFLQVQYVYPFPASAITRAVDSARAVVCIEQNATGQLASLIREHTGKHVHPLLKYDGRQWTPEEIALEVKKFVIGE